MANNDWKYKIQRRMRFPESVPVAYGNLENFMGVETGVFFLAAVSRGFHLQELPLYLLSM